MSIIKAMKRAFGFSGSDDDEYDGDFQDESADNYRDATVVPLKEIQAAADSAPQHDEAPVQADSVADAVGGEPAGDSEVMAIFDGVIAIFNEAQPQFIRDCLDREAQRRYLYDALDSSIKQYLERVASRAREEALQANDAERRQLKADIEDLRRREQQAEQNRVEQQNKQLSAQRQQRALNQRVKDLENQVASLEAEREQFQLETKSLLNKLKVAEVKDGDLTAQRDEIEELKKLVSAKNAENSRLDMLLAQKEEELRNALAAADEARKEADDAAGAQMSEEDREMIRDITAQLDKFEEIKKAKDDKIARQADALTAKDAELSAKSATIAAQNSRIAELQRSVEELQGTIAEMRQNDALAVSLQERRDLLSAVAAKPDEPVEEQPAPKRKTRRRKAKPAVSAIDDNLDSVDWLLTAPSEENPARSQALNQSPDPDFGYQPPVRKDMADNDAQLSLF